MIFFFKLLIKLFIYWKPNATYCVVRVEYIGGRRVVDNDDLVEVPSQATQVLDVVSSVEDARLSEEATPEGAPLVQEIGHGVGILRRGH